MCRMEMIRRTRLLTTVVDDYMFLFIVLLLIS